MIRKKRAAAVIMGLLIFAAIFGSLPHCDESADHDECVTCACAQCKDMKLLVQKSGLVEYAEAVIYISFYETSKYENNISESIYRPPASV